jgi:replicative DNA helicase
MKSLEVKSIRDLQADYRSYVKQCETRQFDMGDWLPSLGTLCKRPLVPGELCFFIGDTGTGKTAVLQNIARTARTHEVLLFEMELPGTLCFERFAAMANGIEQIAVENIYKDDGFVRIGPLDHIWTCESSRLKTEDMQALIENDRAQHGREYTMVIVDYIGLMSANAGSKLYEQVSQAAADLKVLAKETNTIVIAASQIHRKGDDYPDEITLHDAKDSGSIENSCGLLIGVWHDQDERGVLNLRVIKNTKGGGVREPMKAVFDGPTMRITERKPDWYELPNGIDHD